jgi:nicotinamidase-related amidase
MNKTVLLGSSPRNQWQLNAAQCNLVRASLAAQPIAVPALPQNVVMDLARTALVVVDMQNDFCHPQGWLSSIGVDTTAARQPIKPLQTALPVLRGAGVPVVWLNWGNRPDKLNLSPSALHVYNGDGQSVGLGDALPGAPCEATHNHMLEAGSWGASVVEELTKTTR